MSDLAPMNNNPTGINQYKNCPRTNDEQVESIIQDYDRRGISNRDIVSQMLLSEHEIEMSATTVARRRKTYGLKGSGATTRLLPITLKRQLVLDQLAKDPTSRQGPPTIKQAISHDTGIHLTRSFIRTEMHLQDPQGFAIREPSAKKVKRGVLVAIGPHHEWSGDGHDKLAAIGFPIWGMRDKWSGKWLGLWVVPNNRLKSAIAYLYLQLVKEYGGMPIQSTTDCGSETTTVFGLANALREVFSPEIATDELPAHRFLQSISNITIERGWLRLRLQFGDNVKVFWEAGAEIYIDTNPGHRNLVQWLWPRLIQAELDTLRTKFNDHRVRTDRTKKLPSGTSPNLAMSMPWKYGAENCLQTVDVGVVDQLMGAIGSEKLQFVAPEYAEHARSVYEALGVQNLTFQNVWRVFSAMLPLM